MSLCTEWEQHGCFWGDSQHPDFLFTAVLHNKQPGIWSPQNREIWNSSVFVCSVFWNAGCPGNQAEARQGSGGGRLCCWTVRAETGRNEFHLTCVEFTCFIYICQERNFESLPKKDAIDHDTNHYLNDFSLLFVHQKSFSLQERH